MTLHLLIAFVSLFALELVLGIDNIIFVSLLSESLPKYQQQKARILGLSLAVITRIALLYSLFWVVHLTVPLFTLFSQEFSGKNIVLILGGLFLIAKSTHEIHNKVIQEGGIKKPKRPTFFSVIMQILLFDMIFSLDSVITALGMVNNILVMIAAVIGATIVMIMASRFISAFLSKRPTIKLLALSFLVLIGFALFAEGFNTYIPKGYIYFAMAYALAIEMLNGRIKKKA